MDWWHHQKRKGPLALDPAIIVRFMDLSAAPLGHSLNITINEPFSSQRVVDVSLTPLKVKISTYLMLSSDRSVGIMAMIQHCILCLSFRRCLVLQWCLSYLLKDAYNRSCHQMGWWLLTYTTSNQLCYFVVSWDLHHQSFRDSSPRSFFNFFPLLTLKLSILQTPYVFFPPRPAFRHCSQLCSPTPKN